MDPCNPDNSGISFACYFPELYCEVIGTIKKVSWRHLNKNIVVGESFMSDSTGCMFLL